MSFLDNNTPYSDPFSIQEKDRIFEQARIEAEKKADLLRLRQKNISTFFRYSGMFLTAILSFATLSFLISNASSCRMRVIEVEAEQAQKFQECVLTQPRDACCYLINDDGTCKADACFDEAEVAGTDPARCCLFFDSVDMRKSCQRSV